MKSGKGKNLQGGAKKQSGSFVPSSFNMGKLITGRARTTFGASLRNFGLLLLGSAVLILVLWGGYLVTRPKQVPIGDEAIKISKAAIAAFPEPGLGDAGAFAQGELRENPYGEITDMILTPSEIEAMELEKERARLAAQKAAQEAAMRAAGIAPPDAAKAEDAKKAEEKKKKEEKAKRDAFGLMPSAKKGVKKALGA
jgi:phosphopantetheinyl transferase (holo-ACP synthase)